MNLRRHYENSLSGTPVAAKLCGLLKTATERCLKPFQAQQIMGRLLHPDPKKPSLDSMALSVNNAAKNLRSSLFAQALENESAKRVQILECARTAHSTSALRCCGSLRIPESIDIANYPLTASEKPLAAKPSHTNAGAQCIQAAANRCVDSRYKESEESESGSMNHRKASCDRLYVHNSRAPTAFQNHNAGMLGAGKI